MAQCQKKIILIEEHALKDLYKLPIEVQIEFSALFIELGERGYLKYPEGKKFSSYNLFEGRINEYGAWRCIYAYIKIEKIVVLNIFSKKTQKTPKKEIEKAISRLNKL